MKKNLFFPNSRYILFFAILIFYSCKKQIETAAVSSFSRDIPGSKDLVLTPAGWLPKANVHSIGPDEHLTRRATHMFKIQSHSNILLEDFGEFRQNRTPFSKFSDNKLTIPGVNNWIVFSNWVNPGTNPPINYFSSNWIVPTAPTTNHSQTIFLFNGLQNITGADILQPVLQWGTSYGGGGSNWYIANWYVWTTASGTSAAAVQLPLIQVAVGTNLTGVMELTGQFPDGSPTFSCAFTGYSNSLSVYEGAVVNKSQGTVPFIPAQPWAVETLEAYGGANTPPSFSTDYPPDYEVRMTGIHLATATGNSTVAWAPDNNVVGFGQHVLIVSNSSPGGEVDLCFHPAPIPTGLNYNFTYPVVLNWTNIPGAASYDVSYTVYTSSGPIVGNVNTATNSYTFPFTSGQYPGAELVSTVRVHLTNGDVSNYSSGYNRSL